MLRVWPRIWPDVYLSSFPVYTYQTRRETEWASGVDFDFETYIKRVVVANLVSTLCVFCGTSYICRLCCMENYSGWLLPKAFSCPWSAVVCDGSVIQLNDKMVKFRVSVQGYEFMDCHRREHQTDWQLWRGSGGWLLRGSCRWFWTNYERGVDIDGDWQEANKHIKSFSPPFGSVRLPWVKYTGLVCQAELKHSNFRSVVPLEFDSFCELACSCRATSLFDAFLYFMAHK